MSRQKLQFPLTPVQMEILGAALACAEYNGWPVFPCNPADKRPLTRQGFKDASTDRATVERWWRQYPGALIGLPTGPASGVWVLDVDIDASKEVDGRRALQELEAKHGNLPATLVSCTPRGGMHYFFSWPAGAEIRNSAGRIGRALDVRAEGGYVIVPPSRRADGVEYRWRANSLAAAIPAPDWLVELVQEASNSEPNGNGLAAAAAAQTGRRRDLAKGVTAGERNDSATRLAGYLLRHFVDPIVVLELLLAWNSTRCEPPLSADEIVRAVDSICGRELRRRQGHG